MGSAHTRQDLQTLAQHSLRFCPLWYEPVQPLPRVSHLDPK